MTRSILLAGAALISVSISPLNADASEAPWCAVISRSDGDVHWDCTYRSIEECRPNVIASNGNNRGFCNPSPYYVANPTKLRNSRQASQMGSKTIAKSEKTMAVKKENLGHRRNADTHSKISQSTITTKIETPLQPDDKSNAEFKSNAELEKSIATKIETPQSSESDGKSIGEVNLKPIAANTEPSPSSQLDDESVMKIAKIAIAEKMENTASVVFLEMKRAAREDALGNSIDTVCGRVRGKLAGDTGDRPFLYVVQKDEAYIGAYTIATTEYRKICN